MTPQAPHRDRLQQFVRAFREQRAATPKVPWLVTAADKRFLKSIKVAADR